MEQNIIEVLEAAKVRLEEVNGTLRDGCLGKQKNNVVINKIKELLPEKENRYGSRFLDADFVYPGRT